MGDDHDIDDDLLQKSESRQSTEQLVRTTLDDAPATGAPASVSRVREVAGYGAVELFLRTDVESRITVEESCSGDGPWAEVARFDTTLAPDGVQFICRRVEPCGTHMRILQRNLDVVDASAYDFCATGLPVGGATGAGGGGGGGSNVPGKTIVTKPDVAVPAAVETPVLFLADIPPGSRRVSIRNTGADAVRIKGSGEGGGATRGQELSPDQTMSIGTGGGALAPLDAFSPLGTTLGFFFERD